MTWLKWALSFLPGLGSLAEKGLDYYIAKANGNVQKAIALMEADKVRIAAQRDITIAGMSHPIWWVVWIVWMLPPGFYHGAVFFVSTFDMWLNTPGCYVPKMGDALKAGRVVCEWFVREVPEDQKNISALAAAGILGLQVGTGLIGSIINRVWK